MSVLNVAHDLRGKVGWPDVVYMQVGLIDGPGNTHAAYCAAALALHALQERGPTMVFCHNGGRSLAVVLMYLNLLSPHRWDDLLAILKERIDVKLPEVNEAHITAFNQIDWEKLIQAIQ